MKIHTFMMAAAILALTAGHARAETVRETTVIKEVDLPGVKKFDIKSFDDNHDGVITVEEAGDHLFHLFDLDSNGVIDNIEFTKKTIITVIPLEKQTTVFRDLNDDGRAETHTYTYSTFMERSGLGLFAENKSGMSPQDFVKKSFLEMDTNNSHVIEPAEWRAAYVASRVPEANKQYRYNN